MDESIPRLGDRALFPELAGSAYLAYAAISPLSAPVQRAMGECLTAYGRSGLDGFAFGTRRGARLRERVARLLQADSPAEIGFVPNTTQGVIDIANSIPWQAGERIVLVQGEFPANITPWQQAAQTFDLELAWCPLEPFLRDHEEGVAVLDRVLGDGARLVAVSAVQFKTGLRMPLTELATLCHNRGAELFVDAIQGFGATPLSAKEGWDYLAAGGHKAAMGPQGSGVVYVRDDKQAQLVPRLGGWLAQETPLDFIMESTTPMRYDKRFRQRADFVEGGTPNLLGQTGLDASLALIEELGVAEVHAHINRYHDALECGLQGLGFRSQRTSFAAGRSTILSAAPPAGADVVRTAAQLKANGVVCSTPEGLLRFAPHWPNSLAEVPVVLDAVRRALSA